ncbi:hypothetical protein BSY18_4156 (plasmid) [Blastomonas sp. RAC04]|nr:hypothetical protein BSY18_4156 [Blastomonas sp. RAC04]
MHSIVAIAHERALVVVESSEDQVTHRWRDTDRALVEIDQFSY